ncbi:MAG TPA: NAD(P)-dependent oxidoreductase [Terriglobia bacterium]|nr:NAD(P)-dependent oxidoreductase [Terriglobia bacterium]
MKTALVIGGAGFVGRHLIPLLVSSEFRVVSCDPAFPCRPKTKHSIDEIPLAFGNVDWSAFQFDIIVHLGAHIQDISEREKGDIEKYQDIGLDLAVMRYVAAHPPKECFIYPSSCSIDSAETDPYAFSKTVGERMAMALHKQGIPVVILRPFSGYGGDQAESYPFSAILSRAMAKHNPLTVWGNGRQVRDWIEISDLAKAFLWAIDHAPRGTPVDIGTGIGTSLFMLAQKIAEGVGYSPTITADTSKPASSMRRIADITLAETFGFEANILLEEGISRAIFERTKR